MIWAIFLFLMGACVGSFLNVVIYRLPRGESIVFPGSHCPSCGRGIRGYDNIPILSWLVLRGRCRDCKAPISPRYISIEAIAAILICGLYVCFYVLKLRSGVGRFEETWPVYAAHAALLAGLLAGSVVDIELFIVPLPVMWVCTIVGLAAATAAPTLLMPPASPGGAVVCMGMILGFVIAKYLVHRGFIQPSFIDVSSNVAEEGAKKVETVAITSAHGVRPRVEILRELLFLAPAIGLGVAAWLVYRYCPAVRNLADRVFDVADPGLGRHLAGGMGAVIGMLTGIAWIWGTRIFGTLAFGKEAMGMGDVHIMAAVGAVMGWKAVTLTFFAAPVIGLLYAIYLLAAKGKRELPYGPWLAAAAAVVMVFYDAIWKTLLHGL